VIRVVIPEPPYADAHAYGHDETVAWQAGWEAGYEQAVKDILSKIVTLFP
jgi:hypothetical protein